MASVTVGRSSSQDDFLGLPYTESSLWINDEASDATADAGLDELLLLTVSRGPSIYTVDRTHERGGFRYLRFVNNSTASIEITNFVTNYTAATQQYLRAYKGTFL